MGHPDEGVLSLSRLVADAGLKLAINATLEVADVGPEVIGGPPVDELAVRLRTRARAVPALQIGAFQRPDRGGFRRQRPVGRRVVLAVAVYPPSGDHLFQLTSNRHRPVTGQPRLDAVPGQQIGDLRRGRQLGSLSVRESILL